MAVAFKYACLQMFCIPTDDIDDPDKTTPPPSAQKQSNNQEPVSEQAIIEEIRLIVTKANLDRIGYFSQEEIDREKKIAQAAVNTGVLQKQLERLKVALEKREKEYEPIPFENDMPEGMEAKTANNGEMDIF
jgi:hypothetical protein